MGDEDGAGLTLIVIRVGDMGASRRFYEALGLVLREERHEGGPAHLSADVGGVVLELYPRAAGPTGTGVPVAGDGPARHAADVEGRPPPGAAGLGG